MTVIGFGLAVIVGGLSSGYSFRAGQSTSITLYNANTWFYTMAASCALGLGLLYILQPYDYNKHNKRGERGVTANLKLKYREDGDSADVTSDQRVTSEA